MGLALFKISSLGREDAPLQMFLSLCWVFWELGWQPICAVQLSLYIHVNPPLISSQAARLRLPSLFVPTKRQLLHATPTHHPHHHHHHSCLGQAPAPLPGQSDQGVDAAANLLVKQRKERLLLDRSALKRHQAVLEGVGKLQCDMG